MPTPAFVHDILGWRNNGNPNVADADSNTSCAIADDIFTQLGITRVSTEDGQTLGNMIEEEVANGLHAAFGAAPWTVGRGRSVTDFLQYQHLAAIQAIANANPELRSEYGGEYLIKPDVTVGKRVGTDEVLHAVVSCKFTIRSDRVQNIRHEFTMLARHRRGRLPHCMSVTSEPLPSRLASIARGAGGVDRVYHLMFDELHAATARVSAASGHHLVQGQIDILSELIDQRRLASWDDMLRDLTSY